jgi:hypothetical protein
MNENKPFLATTAPNYLYRCLSVFPQILFEHIEGSPNLRFALNISHFLVISTNMGRNGGEIRYDLGGGEGQAMILTVSVNFRRPE